MINPMYGIKKVGGMAAVVGSKMKDAVMRTGS